MNRLRVPGIATAVGLLALACAQALPPPGGLEDRMPPRIIATTPDTLAVVESLEGPVIFRFNERISERGITNNAAMVSPRTGDVKVERGREEIRVEIEGGWRPGLVYRVLLMPGIRDLFGNELKEPAELVFSTGPAIAGAVIAGVVTDRITGRPAERAFIEATILTDSITYVTAVDSSSFYSFRYLSPGPYEMLAYTDENRNGKRDAAEAASMPQRHFVNRDGDTTIVELAVMRRDTTPPRLTRAEPDDSLHIRLFSDDYLDPAAPIGLVRVVILSLPDSVEIPGPHALMTVDSFNKLPKPVPDSLGIPPDSLRQDSVPPDSMGAEVIAGPPRGRPVPAAPGFGSAGARAATRVSEFGSPAGPLPFQEFVLVPATPLSAGAKYLIEVLGLTNIWGRTSGGGTAEVEMPAPPPPPPDTAAARVRSRSVP